MSIFFRTPPVGAAPIGQRLDALHEGDDFAFARLASGTNNVDPLTEGFPRSLLGISASFENRRVKRDMCVSPNTGFMQKIGKLAVRAISTLRPSCSQCNAVASLQVAEARLNVSASSTESTALAL